MGDQDEDDQVSAGAAAKVLYPHCFLTEVCRDLEKDVLMYESFTLPESLRDYLDRTRRDLGLSWFFFL